MIDTQMSEFGGKCLWTVALTGGIGCGKSVVSRMLRCMGYDVYDCDSNAKRLMDADPKIKCLISSEICPGAVSQDGVIDRNKLSETVFSDPARLLALNNAVHQSVRDDFSRWRSSRRLAFVETAILYQSSLDLMVDEVWTVDAPRELRIERVMDRNNLTRTQIEMRIDAQDSYIPARIHALIRHLLNDGVEPLLPQVLSLLSSLPR